MNCTVAKRQSGYRFFRQALSKCLVGLTLAFCTTRTVGAQAPTVSTSPVDEPTASDKQKTTVPMYSPNISTKTPVGGSIVVAPIPLASPAVGNGVILIGGYIFPLRKSDTVSPPSIIGGAWVGTDNGSRAWVAGTELFFDQDRYHAVSGFAHGDLDYNFYGTGTISGDAGRKFALNQTGDVFFGEILRRTFWQVLIGPRLWFAKSKLKPQNIGEEFPGLPPLDVDFTLNSLGFKIERDTTPNRFYPDAGTMFRFSSDFFAKDIGGTFTFQSYNLTLNSFHSLGSKQVLAYNAFACATTGDAPFFGQCIFGMKGELRGYPAGRYIDKTMLATQLEYRRSLPWRLGIVAFGGLGEVAPRYSDFTVHNILPSGGVGPRFMLSGKYHVNLRADIAWGKNGHTFSMGLGESF